MRKILVLGLTLLLFVIGCESKEVAKEEPQQETQLQTEDVTNEEEMQDEELGFIAPLSGVSYETPKLERPIAVIINNDIAARPQTGLYKADLVYEVLSEGDITRFIAIYQSEMPDVVGPVRSARDYFIDLSNGYSSLFVFHGWSPAAKAKIEAGEIDGLNGLFYDGTLFNRASFRKAPHNSYITYENIQKGAEKLNYDVEKEVLPLTFTKNDNVTGTLTEKVQIKYSTRQATHVEYIFNKEKQHYERYSGGVKTTDLETLEEVITHNIFIVETEHAVVDDKGRRVIDITSGGKGILIQGGLRNEVEWKSIDGRIVPYNNGEQVGFLPGKTWIQIVPSLGTVHYE